MNIKANAENLVPCRACGSIAVIDTRNGGIKITPCDCVIKSLSDEVAPEPQHPLI